MCSRSRQAEVAAKVAGLSLLSHTVLVQQIAEGGQVCSRSRQAEVAAEVAGLSLLSHAVLVQQIAEGSQVCVVDQDR